MSDKVEALSRCPAGRSAVNNCFTLKFKTITLMGIDEKVKHVYCSAVYLFCKVIIFIDNKKSRGGLISKGGERLITGIFLFCFDCVCL